MKSLIPGIRRIPAWTMLLLLVPVVWTLGAGRTPGSLSIEDGTYLYAGQKFADGVAPYESTFDRKGPMTPMVTGVGVIIARALGTNEAAIVRLVFLLISALVVLGAFFLLRAVFQSERTALMGVVLFATLWVFVQASPAGRWPAVLMLLFEVLCLASAGRQRWLLAGVFGSLSVLSWQRAALVWLAALAVAALQPGGRRGRATLRFLAGSLLPVALFGLYFLSRGALFQAYEGMVLFNLRYFERNVTSIFGAFRLDAAQYGGMLFVFWAGILLVPVIAIQRRRRCSSWREFIASNPIAATALAWPLLVGWTILDYQGAVSTYPLMPLVCIGFAWLLERAVSISRDGHRRASEALVWTVVWALILTMFVGARFPRPVGLLRQSTVARAIDKRLDDGDQVLSVGAPQILALMKRDSPTRFLGLGNGVDRLIDATHENGVPGWIDELESIGPRAIVWGKTSGLHAAALSRWVVSRYEGEPIGNVTVFFRRDGEPTPIEAPMPNIVLITIDTMRADHLGCYGYFRDTSPSIDRLAAESILFERCLAPMATTLPSHTSLLTSTYPMEHGVLANVGTGGKKYVPNANLTTFTEVARDLGYRTAGFVSAAPLKKDKGIAVGFETFEEPAGGNAILAADTIRNAISWLGRHKDKPFFMWVHLWDAHHPYAAPRPYGKMFKPDGELDRTLGERGVPDGRVQLHVPPNVVSKYDGEVRYLDDWIGVLLERLRLNDLWNNTAVVLTADHGEGLGQHGHIQHGCVHEEHLRIPLMIRVPGETPRRVSRTVSTVDIVPTLLGMIGRDAWGDLLRQAAGKDVLAEDYEPRPIFAQREMRELLLHPFSYVVSTDEWKLIHEPEGRDYLYHRPTDPHELNDRSESDRDVADELKAQLYESLDVQNERAALFQGDEAPVLEDMDPVQIEQLRALGYIE